MFEKGFLQDVRTICRNDFSNTVQEQFFKAGAERICCILFTCNFTVRNNIMDEELKDYYVPQIFRKVFCEHSKEQPRERGRKDRMKKIGFDNDKYLKMQSEHIRDRIS